MTRTVDTLISIDLYALEYLRAHDNQTAERPSLETLAEFFIGYGLNAQMLAEIRDSIMAFAGEPELAEQDFVQEPYTLGMAKALIVQEEFWGRLRGFRDHIRDKWEARPQWMRWAGRALGLIAAVLITWACAVMVMLQWPTKAGW